MDIMESSRDLSELLDNDAAPDVVDQTRGLVEQVIKKVGWECLIYNCHLRASYAFSA